MFRAFPVSVALLFVAILTLLEVRACQGDEAEAEQAGDAARVELCWLESRHVDGLTRPQRIQTTCGGDYRYAHLKPALTNANVTKAEKSRFDYPGIGIMFSVTFAFERDVNDLLLRSAPTGRCRKLGIFVDGKYWGTAVFRPNNPKGFRAMAGFSNSESWAVRVVNSCPGIDE